MSQLSAKTQFLNQEGLAKQLGKIIGTNDFHTCLMYALAVYAQERTPTPDQLTAVRDFIALFLELPEPVLPLSTPPPLPRLTFSKSRTEQLLAAAKKK